MNKIYIPEGYKPTLDAYDTQRAIAYIKNTFQTEFAGALNLKRVSAPLFVTDASGLNDNLNGYERPVSFDVPAIGEEAEVVHSLAKWKRLALKRYGFSVGNGLYKVSHSLKVSNQRLAALVSVHALILSCICVHGSVIVHNLDLLEVVSLTYKEVVGVVCGSYLNAARTEADLNVIVGNNGNFSAYYGENESLADEVLHILILGVNGNGGIAEHGLGTGGCNFDIAVLALDRVLDVPEVTGLILVLYLSVRKRGKAVRAPVDNSVSAVDKSLVVKVYEYLANCSGAALVHSKSLS